jgi:hypothetical protein
METKIIGIVGKKGSGKDALMLALAKHHEKVIRVAFADDLKEEVCRMFGITRTHLDNNKEKFRRILQELGTLRKEYNGNNYWVDKVREKINLHMANGDLVICTDCRFHHETALIKSLGGKLVRVTRPSQKDDGDTHVSETEQEGIAVDETVINDGSLSDLNNKAKELYAKVINPTLPQGQAVSGAVQSSDGHNGEGKPPASPPAQRKRNHN